LGFSNTSEADLGRSSAVTISTARRIILEGIQILIFATKGFKGGKVHNQVVVIKHILVGIPTSIWEGTIIHKHI
jgi:hypothetical protein